MPFTEDKDFREIDRGHLLMWLAELAEPTGFFVQDPRDRARLALDRLRGLMGEW